MLIAPRPRLILRLILTHRQWSTRERKGGRELGWEEVGVGGNGGGHAFE